MRREFGAKVGILAIAIHRSCTDDQDAHWQSGEKVFPTGD